MAPSEDEFESANARMSAKRKGPIATAARYDRGRGRIVVSLDSGVELAFPPRAAQGLAPATARQLSEIEITPSGLGLHWPELDADLYLPALLEGVFGSEIWTAAQLPGAGGHVRGLAKSTVSGESGRRSGRPRKKVAEG